MVFNVFWSTRPSSGIWSKFSVLWNMRRGFLTTEHAICLLNLIHGTSSQWWSNYNKCVPLKWRFRVRYFRVSLRPRQFVRGTRFLPRIVNFQEGEWRRAFRQWLTPNKARSDDIAQYEARMKWENIGLSPSTATTWMSTIIMMAMSGISMKTYMKWSGDRKCQQWP